MLRLRFRAAAGRRACGRCSSRLMKSPRNFSNRFVSSKVAGEVASLNDPALDRLLDFAAEVGLVALIHNDIDVPFPKEEAPPAYLEQMRALLKRHPKTTIIWAHTGLGRVIRPKNHAEALE